MSNVRNICCAKIEIIPLTYPIIELFATTFEHSSFYSNHFIISIDNDMVDAQLSRAALENELI